MRNDQHKFVTMHACSVLYIKKKDSYSLCKGPVNLIRTKFNKPLFFGNFDVHLIEWNYNIITVEQDFVIVASINSNCIVP